MRSGTTDSAIVVDGQNVEKMSSDQRLKCLQALKDSTCPECGSINFRHIDGEVVCVGCGLVRSRSLQYLSANDYSETSSPPTNLGFGRGLGDTLGSRPGLFGRNDLFRVLANAPEGKKDLGLRSRQIRIFQTSNEHPITHRLLEMGSQLSHEFGMEGEDAVFFANHLGKLLRRIGFSAYLLKTGTEAVRTKWLAVATFVYAWQLMERDRGLRKEIEYEPYFPGARLLFKRIVKPTKYKIHRSAWDFVYFQVNAHALWVDHQRLKCEGQLVADVNRLGPNDGTVQSSTLVSEDKKPTCKSLRGGTLANVLNAVQRIERSTRSVVAKEQIRAAVDEIAFPGKSAKKRRQKAYDMYAFLVSVLEVKAGLTPDLFIGSVILRRLVEVYKDPVRLFVMPWATRRPYRIVMKSLERLPLKLKSP
jgi:hypothetical protein